MGKDLHKQRGLRPNVTLFRLRICRMDIFRMVLYLSGSGTRSQSQDQCSLLNVALHWDDNRKPVGRSSERLGNGAVQFTLWALHSSVLGNGMHSRSPDTWFQSRSPKDGRVSPGVRRRSLVLLRELFLGRKRQLWWRICWCDFRNNEHGSSDWRGMYRFTHAADRRSFRMANVILRRSSSRNSWGDCLAHS